MLMSISNASAQGMEVDEKSDKLIDSVYFKSSTLFKCKVQLPEKYNPKKSYKLVIGLPVAFDDFRTIWNDFNVDFIYVTPQAPYTTLLNEKMISDWAFWTSFNDLAIERAAALTADYMADLVSELKTHYNINDIYLMGFSQGAIFTYISGIQRPQLYKGIICLSGPGIFEPLVNPFAGEYAPDWLDEKYLGPAKDLKVFIAHGKEDQAAKHELGVKSKEILTNYGYEVTFYSFDGGHTVDPESLKRVLEWIQDEK